MDRPVIIVGYGGHGRVVAAALIAAGRQVIAAVDPCYVADAQRKLAMRVIDDADLLNQYSPDDVDLALGIGTVGPCDAESRRRLVAENYRAAGYRFTVVRHPFCWLAPDVHLSDGVEIHAGAVVQPGVNLGAFTIVNTRASVDHDCQIGEFCHLAPGSLLSGNVRVGDGTHLGTGSKVIQGVEIGRGCRVAAGATVVRNVADGVAVKGLPAKPF